MKFSHVFAPLFFVLLILLLLFVQNTFQSSTKDEKHVHNFHMVSRKSKSTSSSKHSSSAPAPTGEVVDGVKVFNIRKFGAVGDGVTDDTQAFNKAWNSACKSSTTHQKSSSNSWVLLLVPQKYSFLVQSIMFRGPCKSHLVLQIDGRVVAPDGPKKWEKRNSKSEWLDFYGIHGMTMQGGGLINGRGQKWWNLPCAGKGSGCHDTPNAIRFLKSSNLLVQGIRVENSPKFHMAFDDCQKVRIEFLSLKSPGDSPNTDGIHIEGSNNVEIYHSIIAVGDDCISLGEGSYNVDIKNVTCGPSHGISIGSLGRDRSQACVKNITVSDSVIKESDNGVRIKTWQGGSGSVSKISFKNIEMDKVRNPIIINQYYCLKDHCSNQTSALIISDITYKKIYGTYDVKTPPVRLACSDSVPCTNITLSEVQLHPAGGGGGGGGDRVELDPPFCWKAYGLVHHTLVTPPLRSCLLGGFPNKNIFLQQAANKLC